MAFTDHCDVFGAVHEEGFNIIGNHIMRQRPSLFNYGTEMFSSNPQLLCKPITAHPEVTRRGNPLITVEDPLPILGSQGLLGINFCFQVTELKFDFYPGDQFSIPQELGPPLEKQRIAIVAEICGAIVCPDKKVSDHFGDEIAKLTFDQKQGKENERKDEKERPPITPIPGEKIECFCLQLYSILHIERIGPLNEQKLAIRLDDLEIVDIRPEALENNLECYVATTLRVGILPRIRIALDTIVYKLGQYAILSIFATPISGTVPNNPAVEENLIKVFLNVGVS